MIGISDLSKMSSLAKSQVSTKSNSVLFIKFSSLFLSYIHLPSPYFSNKAVPHIKKIEYFFFLSISHPVMNIAVILGKRECGTWSLNTAHIVWCTHKILGCFSFQITDFLISTFYNAEVFLFYFVIGFSKSPSIITTRKETI